MKLSVNKQWKARQKEEQPNWEIKFTKPLKYQ